MANVPESCVYSLVTPALLYPPSRDDGSKGEYGLFNRKDGSMVKLDFHLEQEDDSEESYDGRITVFILLRQRMSRDETIYVTKPGIERWRMS